MKKTDLAYVAGIIDGEGSINISRGGGLQTKSRKSRAHFMQVNVCNTNEWLIRWLQLHFGGHINCEKPGRNPWSRREIWRWYVAYKKAATFLESVLPYLRIKRPQAELALLFQSTKVPSKPISDQQMAVEEAQRLVMSRYNKGE